jgi:hypothetical protein
MKNKQKEWHPATKPLNTQSKVAPVRAIFVGMIRVSFDEDFLTILNLFSNSESN